MESFSLLKYWRGGGGAAAAAAMRSNASTPASTATTIATSVLRSASETDEDDLCSDVDDDEGPFFDLEFAAVHDDGVEAKEDEDDGGSSARGPDEDDEEHREFNFAVSSDGSAEHGAVQSEAFSPSDDLFFKGKFVPLEPSSIVIAAAATAANASSNPKYLPAVSFLKSATKLRVFMLGLRKHKGLTFEPHAPASAAAATTPATAATASPKQQHQQQTTGLHNKFFIKFKVEEVPIMSLFTRDHSSGNSSSSAADVAKAVPAPATKTPPGEEAPAGVDVAPATAEEKKFAKEVVQKYLSKIKPLYVRVSKRYAEKLRHAGHLTTGDDAAATVGQGGEDVAEVAEPASVPAQQVPAPAPAAPAAAAPTTSAAGVVKGLPAGLRVVRKRLGKSRSASAAVAAAPPPVPQRRDDSLLQQQDGIQSAIAHCKRSFTAADKGNESPLVRSMSDPGEGMTETGCV